jgi:hypothetical protein
MQSTQQYYVFKKTKKTLLYQHLLSLCFYRRNMFRPLHLASVKTKIRKIGKDDTVN